MPIKRGKMPKRRGAAEREARKTEAELKRLAEAQASALINQIYETHFIRASTAYADNNLGQTKASLADCPESFPSMGMGAVKLLANSENHVAVWASADSVFSRDSKYLLTCGSDQAPNQIVSWNMETGESTHPLSVGDLALTAIAIKCTGGICRSRQFSGISCSR